MASIQVFDSEVITVSGLTANTSTLIASSTPFSNYGGDTSARVYIDYEAVDPDEFGPSHDIQAVLEEKIDGEWQPIVYQFSPFEHMGLAPKRILKAQPDLIVVDQGIDDVIFVGGEVHARESVRNASLSGNDIRLAIYAVDSNPGAEGLQSVTISARVVTYGGGLL